MCKEMPVIPVNKVVDPKRIIGKKWRAEEEEWHKGSLTKKIAPCACVLSLRAERRLELLGREIESLQDFGW
jgi:hypothetical protein